MPVLGATRMGDVQVVSICFDAGTDWLESWVPGPRSQPDRMRAHLGAGDELLRAASHVRGVRTRPHARRGARHVTLLPLAGIACSARARPTDLPRNRRHSVDCSWNSRLFLCACSLNLRAGVRGSRPRRCPSADLVPSNLLGQRHDEPTTGVKFCKLK